MRIFISISVLFFYALLLQAKNEVIDHRQFLCSYYYCYSKDTIKNDKKGEDLLFLAIGKNLSKCYSYYTYQSDSLRSTVDGKAKFRALFKEAIKREGYMANSFPHSRMTTCIYKKYPHDNMMTVTDCLMSQYYVYDDSLGIQNWGIDGDSIKNILGYNCQKATCKFRGRSWTAWFALDVPISDGPWKFYGLPGLIMEVYDEGRQQYFCIKGLQKVADTPIVFDVFNRKRIRIDRKSFLKLEYNYFRNSNSINEAMTGISLDSSDSQRNYDLIERE
nr:GLPGLI family protein [Prevotella sp.]